MGLPVRFVTAVNVNDIVARTVAHGDFSKADSVVGTLAPAMDIQVQITLKRFISIRNNKWPMIATRTFFQIPYNVERLVYIYSGGDTKTVNEVIGAMEKTGKSTIPNDIHNKVTKTDT